MGSRLLSHAAKLAVTGAPGRPEVGARRAEVAEDSAVSLSDSDAMLQPEIATSREKAIRGLMMILLVSLP